MVLEPYSIRMSETDKRLAESLRKVLGEKSIGGTLRRILHETASEYGLEPEQPVKDEVLVVDNQPTRQAA